MVKFNGWVQETRQGNRDGQEAVIVQWVGFVYE